MTECIIPTKHHYTACASLAALGVQLSHLDLFGPIRERVLIAQKTIKHTPSDKLYDAFISVLAGAGGLVEINSRLSVYCQLFRTPYGNYCCRFLTSLLAWCGGKDSGSRNRLAAELADSHQCLLSLRNDRITDAIKASVSRGP
jgi:hypothetical protein